MNRFLQISILAVIALSLTGCTNETCAIKEAAYSYALLTSEYQIDSAEAYATEETKATTLVMARNIMQAVGDEYIKSDQPASIEIVKVATTSDTDAYAVYHKTTPLKNFTDTLNMKKRDGIWLVHCPLIKVKLPQASTMDSLQNNQGYRRLKFTGLRNAQTDNLK